MKHRARKLRRSMKRDLPRKRRSMKRDLPPRACMTRCVRGRRKVGKRTAKELAAAGWILATETKMRRSCLSKTHKFRWTCDTKGRIWAKLKTRKERGLA